MVLTVSFGLSPVIGLSCHRRQRKFSSANLTPASRRQDHTTSPSAPAPFVKSALASTASRPAFVTIASRPLLERDEGRYGCDLGVRSRTPAAADWHDGQAVARMSGSEMRSQEKSPMSVSVAIRAVIPGRAERELRCAIAHRRISRFRVVSQFEISPPAAIFATLGGKCGKERT
jgi:hypothetical protein